METEGAADGAAPAEPADGAAPANRPGGRTRKSAKRSRSSARKRRTPCSCGGPPLSGTRAQRYQVTLHVDLQTLAAIGGEGSDESDTARHAEAGGAVQAADRGEVGARGAARGPDRGNGFCHLEDGTRVSAETARRLCCDGSLVRVIRGKEGEILDLGRRTRTISPALRRALEIRDGGCRFPGCGLRFFDGHHVKHWLLGGRTELANLVSLCRFHHRCVHEDRFRVKALSDGRFQFFDRKGWPIPDRRPPPRLAAGAVERLVADNLRRGITPRWDTPSATYERARQIPWELEERALAALDPAEPPAQEEDVESEGESGPRG